MVKELMGVGTALLPEKASKPAAETAEKSFGAFLADSLQRVDSMQKDAEKAVESVARAEGSGVQEAMVAVEKADVAFKLMMEVRQKILDAYQEIMRMQV